MSRSSPERALRQRAGGGTSPLRPPLLLAAEDRGAHGRPRMLHRRQLHRVVAPRGGRSLRHLLGLVLVEGNLAAAEKALFRGEMGQFWPTRRRASWVAPARESTRHTGPRCWTGGERRLTLRCRSPTIRGLCLEAAAQRRPISPRHRSARRKATYALPRRRDSSGIVPAECPGPSALAQRPARLASGQFGRMAQHP